MRLVAILLAFLVGGFGWALWRGIDDASAWLAGVTIEEPEPLILTDVELTSAPSDPDSSDPNPEPVPERTGVATSEPPRGPVSDSSAALEAEPNKPVTSSPEAAPEAASSPARTAALDPSSEPMLEISITPTASPDTRRITGDQVNLRQGPDVDTASLGLLSLDDPVAVLEAQGGWLRVRTQDSKEGWVAARFVANAPG